MRFGRVVGTVTEMLVLGTHTVDQTQLHLSVTLEDGATVAVIRSETVAMFPGPGGTMDLAWQADQYTQETIGNELALAGWEPIGTTDEPGEMAGAALAASSPTYIVRLM